MKHKNKKSAYKNTDKNNTVSNITVSSFLKVGIIGILSTVLCFIFDKIIMRFVNNISVPAITQIFVAITMLGNAYVFGFIAAILIIALIINKKPIMSFVLSILTAFALVWLLKQIFNRPRPFEAGLATAQVIVTSSSLPSGHTMMFFAIIPILAKNFPKLKITLWIIAILVGISRIYLGVHYISDVVAGAFIGYAIGWTFMKLQEKYGWKI